MDLFQLLRRNDYYEISGNKMTSYSSTLGGGSINYWNGKRAGFCSTNHPLCSLTAFGQVLSTDSKLNLLQTMYHIWQIDGVVAKYQSHNRTYIEERKTIFDDTFVSMFELHSEQDVSLILQFSGAINENSNLEIDNNYLIIEERHKDKEAQSADSVIYKVIGITGDGEWLFEPSTKCYQWQKELNLISSHRSSEDCAERFSLIVAGGDTRDEALQRYRKAIDNPAELFIDRRQYYEDYFKNNVPVFDCDNHAVKKMYYFIYYMVNANIYDFKSGLLNGEFESTGKFGLNAQWFWDSAFGAINEKWLNDVPFPRSSMSNTINAQRADGLLPFVLCEDEFLYVSWEIVQPFVLPIAIWDYYLKTGDLFFLREALPKLVKFDQWLVANRSPKDDGLINLQVPGESGWDNSKRYIFSHHMVQSDSPLIREKRFIQSPDFNSYFYLGRVIIAKIACLFGDNPLSEEFQAKSRKTLNAIKSMWNSETGLWHDRFEDNYEFTKVKTPGGMIPAITGALNPDDMDKVVGNLLNPKLFWTQFPVPSLSLDDSDYRLDDSYYSYWNGRVWPQINWLIIEGLMRNNRIETARELCRRSIAMCSATNEPWCTENYHPESGEPFFTCNIFNYIWGGIFNDILIRRVMGIQCFAPKNQLVINPLLNDDVHYLSISNLKMNDHSFEIKLTKDSENIRLELTHKGSREVKVLTSNGEKILYNSTINETIGTFNVEHWLA